MATLSITVDDSIVPRLRTAYGASDNQTLKAMIIADIKKKVIDYEVSVADTQQGELVAAAMATKLATIEAAKASANTEIVLT